MLDEDYCERCRWGEVALDAPCYVCMKPNYEKMSLRRERKS